MTAPAQGHLWGGPPDPTDASDTDSYCTPPEVMEPVHEAAGLVKLDPWTNSHAIAHGWVRAEESWTIDDGHHPGTVTKQGELDISEDPRRWPLGEGEFAFGNPPYSNPLPFVMRFVREIEQARAWGMLLLKTDNRVRWASVILERQQPIVLWKGPINFFHRGERVKGNNFASTLYVVDGTDTSPSLRARHLAPIFHDVAWVYR